MILENITNIRKIIIRVKDMVMNLGHIAITMECHIRTNSKIYPQQRVASSKKENQL